MKFLVFLVSFLISTVALADPISGSFVYPTTNTNGTTIPATGPGSLTKVTVEYGTCSTNIFGTKLGGVDVTPPTTVYTTPDMPPGHYCIRANATNTYAVVSDYSAIATKDISNPKPNPPSNLIVNNPVAYTIIKQKNKFVFSPVGIYTGSACDSATSVTGYLNLQPTQMYGVDRDQVAWSGRQKPDVVVAICTPA